MSTKTQKKLTRVLSLEKEEVFELLIQKCVPVLNDLNEVTRLQPLGKKPDSLCTEPILSLLSWRIQTEEGEDGVPTNQMTGLWKVGVGPQCKQLFLFPGKQGRDMV